MPTASSEDLREAKTARDSERVRPALLAPGNFLLATRDTGYKSTALAVAEFVDNSVQAGARSVGVDVLTTEDENYPIELLVTDDGAGMDAATLASALTFGGSSRFDDRSSLGRYGMGLPNGALSRARRVEVYTWQRRRVRRACLDVDEIVAKGRRTLPPIEVVSRPSFLPEIPHGTAVRLQRCDRLEYRRASTLIKKLHQDLGRIYRHFLGDKLTLRVNGRTVAPIDPLFLLPAAKTAKARQFGDTLTYRLSGAGGPGLVKIRFSELPIEHWHDLSSDEKRRLGVTNAPTVSIVRADREVDRGWYFMGGKRRENYDDWWRCEVSFDASLDELFGITHAKQAISPTDELLQVLVPDLEPIARALNSRVRHRFELVKVANPLGAAEKQAARAEAILPALPGRRETVPAELRQVVARHAARDDSRAGPYRIVVTDLPTTAAFEVVVRERQLFLLLNARHPLFRDLYGPLAMSESEKDQDVAKRVALAVLAAARAEVGASRRADRNHVREFREAWADVMATFFNA